MNLTLLVAIMTFLLGAALLSILTAVAPQQTVIQRSCYHFGAKINCDIADLMTLTENTINKNTVTINSTELTNEINNWFNRS